jgi:hypothetical protein
MLDMKQKMDKKENFSKVSPFKKGE